MVFLFFVILGIPLILSKNKVLFFWTGLQDFSGLTGLGLIMIILKNPVILFKIMVRFFQPRISRIITDKKKIGVQLVLSVSIRVIRG
jgi:hypothetical protein